MRMRLSQAALTPFHGLSLQQEIAIHEHNEQESPMNQVMDTRKHQIYRYLNFGISTSMLYISHLAHGILVQQPK